MKAAPSRRYKNSEKREATKEQNRAAIEAAAWDVFCTMGMDAANIRDIVKRSGISQGTFYNYYGTKEAIFEVLAQNVLERIRSESRASRAQAATLEQFLSFCYESYFSLLQSIDGALSFIDRNQHHIRGLIYRSSAVSGLGADLADDLQRFLPPDSMSSRDRLLVASIIIAAGAEAIFQVGRKQRTINHVQQFLAALMLKGLSGWPTR